MRKSKSIDVDATRADYKRRLWNAKNLIILTLSASIILYIILTLISAYNNAEAFGNYISSIKWYYYLLALLTVFAADVIAFPKWALYSRLLNIKMGTRKSFELYMSLNAMNITPGRWGRAIASYLIKKSKGIGVGHTFPAVVADIFTDFVGFGIVSVFFSFIIHRYFIESLFLVLIFFIPFIFLFSNRAYKLIKRKLEKHRRLAAIFENGDQYFQSSKKFSKRTYVYSLLFTVPSNILSGVSLYFIMLAFGVHVSAAYIPTIIFIYCIVTLLGMVSGIPGSLGVAEVSLLALLIVFFKPLGVGLSLATLITIFARVAMLWWVELYGFIFLAYVLRTMKTLEGKTK